MVFPKSMSAVTRWWSSQASEPLSPRRRRPANRQPACLHASQPPVGPELFGPRPKISAVATSGIGSRQSTTALLRLVHFVGSDVQVLRQVFSRDEKI